MRAKSQLAGRILMTIATINYGLIPPLVDFTETHVFHPDWPPHARMHMVWLLAVNTSLSLLSLYFLWLHSLKDTLGIRIAGTLGVLVYGGFFISASTISFYGGALNDKGGVPPIMGIDANIIGFTLATLIFLIGWYMARLRP